MQLQLLLHQLDVLWVEPRLPHAASAPPPATRTASDPPGLASSRSNLGRSGSVQSASPPGRRGWGAARQRLQQALPRRASRPMYQVQYNYKYQYQ